MIRAVRAQMGYFSYYANLDVRCSKHNQLSSFYLMKVEWNDTGWPPMGGVITSSSGTKCPQSTFVVATKFLRTLSRNICLTWEYEPILGSSETYLFSQTPGWSSRRPFKCNQILHSIFSVPVLGFYIPDFVLKNGGGFPLARLRKSTFQCESSACIL